MSEKYMPSVEAVIRAKANIRQVVLETPLQTNLNLSRQYEANIHLKREDLQIVHSYKIRGAFNKISSISEEDRKKGVICASAGNHAQGVAYACSFLKIKGTIFMPATTPLQKIEQVEMFGEDWITIVIEGDTFDDAQEAAHKAAKEDEAIFIPPFDDKLIIEGQATIAEELLRQTHEPIDYLFIPIGGGGLAAGISAYFSYLSPKTKIIGVEPLGAPSMKTSIALGKNTRLESIDKFVDGAAVMRCGDLNFDICKDLISDIVLVPEGEVCADILTLYNRDALIVEPAGTLSISALSQYKEEIKGKNVVCVVSGSNNDITRTQEIRERAMVHQGLKHYFILELPQRAGALKDFLLEVLTPTMDITHFEYSKKSYRSKGPVVIGIELKETAEKKVLFDHLDKSGINYKYINDRLEMYHVLI